MISVLIHAYFYINCFVTGLSFGLMKYDNETYTVKDVAAISFVSLLFGTLIALFVSTKVLFRKLRGKLQ